MPIMKQQLPHINVTDTEVLYIASPFKRETSIYKRSIVEDWLLEIRARQCNPSDFIFFIEEY